MRIVTNFSVNQNPPSMKYWILVLGLLLCGVSQAQIKLNKETGLYERKFRISKNEQVFINKLTLNDFEVDDNLISKGSFTHFVNDVSPVVIHFQGQKREGKYVFSSFMLMTGSDVPPVNLEELPSKQVKLWLPIINEKLSELNL